MENIAGIVLRSIYISGTATLLASTWSLVIALILSKNKESRIARILAGFFNSLVGVPTVLVGLLLYLLLSRSGPLGVLDLLYTPGAIIVGEALLITPLLISFMYDVLVKAHSTYWEVAVALGANEDLADIVVLRETTPEILVAILMGFSRAIGELGVALLVGGNIKGFTRVMTTTIALYVSMGEFEEAVYLGLFLVIIVFLVSLIVRILKVKIE